MIVNSPLDSAIWWTNASNVFYIVGAVVTALTAAWIVYETHAVALGKRQKFFLFSEILGAIAAIICVLGSVGAISFGNVVSRLKDVDLAKYEKDAEKAKSDAATANQQAADANLKNTQLKIQLGQHEADEKKTDAELAAQSQKNAQLAQAIADQQQKMAKTIHSYPEVDFVEWMKIADELSPYAGQKVIIRSTGDTDVRIIAVLLEQSLHQARIDVSGTVHVGEVYVGINVETNPNYEIVPLATKIIETLKAHGIPVRPGGSGSWEIPKGVVLIEIGPPR
jgi:hypothetical protein